MSAHPPSGRLRLAGTALAIAVAALVSAGAAWSRTPAHDTVPSAAFARGHAPHGHTRIGRSVMNASPTSGRGRKLTVKITPSRPADGAGWYRSPVTFTTTGTDSKGNSLSCSAPQTYSGPDVSHLAIVGTCTDSMGKNQATATFDLRYDATAPVVAVDAGRPADRNGWFNSPVTFSTHGTDAMSGVSSCTAPVTYSVPDTAAGSESGSCTDAAGNTGTGLTQFKYDSTAPSVTATAARAPDGSGWYTAGVGVSFSGVDATSGGVSCDPAVTYSGPDSATASVSGSCTDVAGNSGSGSLSLEYDASAPSVTVDADRSADHNGWFNGAVTFTTHGSDAVSGLVGCTLPVTYLGPDTATGTQSGSCTDAAGNTASATANFKFDATAPTASATASRPPNISGWYRAPFDVSFSGDDATSGPVTCSPPATYGGPDTANGSLSGSCVDQAGNTSAPASYDFEFDATAPTVTAVADRAADSGGWFNHGLAVSFSGSDALSDGVTCDPAKPYSGPDTAAASVSGTCTDAAGNSGSASFAFKYDATAPNVSATPGRAPNANGWYRAPVGVSFSGTDATSGVVSCDPSFTYSGPDSAAASVSGSCTDAAGNSGSGLLDLAYDATPPTVAPALTRPADNRGWYNHPVATAFTGTDATSQGVTCSAVTYNGPDTATASLTASCSDAAGNTASATTATFKYDSTAPTVTATPERAPNANGWYRTPVGVSFSGVDATSGGVSCDPDVIYSGPDSAVATVSGTCSDAAGNTGNGSLDLAYDATAPAVTAGLGRTPDSGTWYNHAVSVTFSATDALSNGVTCDPAASYSGPDSAGASVTGSCTDAAGNQASATKTFAYDGTAPSVSVTPRRPPDTVSAYTSPVTFDVAGTDATSNDLACDAPITYSGPDSANATVSGSCTDAAGNKGTSSATFAYQAVTPAAPDTSLLSTPDALTNQNLAQFVFASSKIPSTFECSLDGAAATACTSPQGYSGLSDGAHTFSVAATDATGTTDPTPATFSWIIDTTPPVVTAALGRAPDANGWYNHPVSINFSATDTLSGGVSCDPAVSYSGPDTATAVVSGSCTDAAGNSGSGSISFEYDATAPTVTPALARAADKNGWYNHALSVGFSGTDAVSGGVTCDPPASYGGPDGAAATVSGTCTDAAGNTGAGSTTIKYDATAPTVTAALGRSPDSGTWYNHGVSVTFSGVDATSGGVTCDPPASYGGPDSATAFVTGTCTDAAGNQAGATKTFAYDGTAPSVTLTPSRPPDAGGAYTSAVTFDVAGTDATSKGVSCDAPITYSGPDSANATVSGSCSDAAGNQGTGSASFAYQTVAAPPPDTSLLSTPDALTNQSSAQFVFASTASPSTFQCSLDGAAATDCTSPQSYSGLSDGQHTFSVAATNNAGTSDPTPATFGWTIDTVAPDTAFTDFPPDPSNTAASFAITTDADATLLCSLDNAAFAACTSPVSVPLSSLPDGSHTFRARGIDGAGNIDATPASFTWTTDTVAPTLTLTAAPQAVSTSTSATFSWTTSEPAAVSCRIDNALFASCGNTGTKTFTGLTQGVHTFNVRARDGAGNLSTTTSFSWTVDTGPPDTTIDPASKPANPTSSTSASFSFTATEPSTFKCKLDNAPAFTACTSPQSYSGLADGSHTFSVEAVDSVGNVDPTPATSTWLIDTTNPSGAITGPADGASVSGNTQPVTATAADNVSVLSVQFKLDGADLGTPVTAAPYTVTWDTTITADGPHTLTAVIKDEVGNTTTTALVHVTVQNAAAPPSPSASPDLVDVGPGSVDATTRNVMRTSAGRVYVIGNDDSAAVSNPVHAATGAGVIRAYKGNQTGSPTAFAEVDAANHPVSGGRVTATTAFGGVDTRLGSDGIARVLYNDNASSQELIFRTFSTVTDTWGPAETIDSPIGTQARGRIKYALALDGSNVPHVVWVKGTSLLYANRAGGAWSAPVTIATGAPIHPMLAFDASGVLHLTWLEDNGSGSSLRYAVRSAGAWSAPELIPTGAILSNINADQGPSIATDTAGHPYVLYVGPSQGTFGPTGHTAIYGAMQAMEKINGTWTDISPPAAAPPGYLGHTPQIYMHGDDLYAFDGHDTDLNFAYAHKPAGGSWSSLTKLTAQIADGSASIRWDPLHETDPSIIDATTYNEDRLGDRSFLGEIYYMAVKP